MTPGGTSALPPVAELAAALGHRFADETLLRDALSHPSLGAAGRAYERLEFLGDRVLGLIVADLLLRRFPQESEGDLARRFAALVSRDPLVAVAHDLGLGRFLDLARGEEESGGRENPATLADSLEAARAFVAGRWASRIEADVAPPRDAKTALQEWAQGAKKPLPVYRILAMEGPPHEPVFRIEVEVEGFPPEQAQGQSKRAAERAAAESLLAKLQAQHGG